jgi:hypothetical protein
MKISVKATELVDGAIDFVSLVKHGANRSSFKIVKQDQPTENLWAGLMPELDRLQKRLADPSSATTTEKTVSKTETTAQQEAAQIRKQEEAKLRHKLNGLNNQLMNLWEQPSHALFEKLDHELSLAISKCELELATLNTDQQDQQMRASSAFFRRGSTSNYSAATVTDSAYDRRQTEMRKAESQIDLSDNGLNPLTDPDEVNRINLAKFDL